LPTGTKWANTEAFGQERHYAMFKTGREPAKNGAQNDVQNIAFKRQSFLIKCLPRSVPLLYKKPASNRMPQALRVLGIFFCNVLCMQYVLHRSAGGKPLTAAGL